MYKTHSMKRSGSSSSLLYIAPSLTETLDPAFAYGKDSKQKRRIQGFSRVSTLRNLISLLRTENFCNTGDEKLDIEFVARTNAEECAKIKDDNEKSKKSWETLRIELGKELSIYMARMTKYIRIWTTSDVQIRLAYYPDPVKSQECMLLEYGYAPSVTASMKAFGITLIPISTDDICNGSLSTENYDCLLIPGGYVPNYSKALGSIGREAIRAFVRKGGGYVGICAGAFLATSCAKRRSRAGGLDLLPDVHVMDYEHWARGRSNDCVIRLQAAGVGLLSGRNKPEHMNVGEMIITRYCNGPLLTISPTVVPKLIGMFPPLRPHSTVATEKLLASSLSAQNYSSPSESLALFMSDFTNLASFGKKILKPTGFRELPRGIMNKTSALVRGMHGSGRVILISPHLEDGEPLARSLLRNCVRWCSGSSINVERDRVDVSEQIRYSVRDAWLAARMQKYNDRESDEDRAQVMRSLLSSSSLP